MGPFIGSKKGHFSRGCFSLSAYQPCLKQIAFAVSVNLTPDGFEAGDLLFCLSARPRQHDCRASRGLHHSLRRGANDATGLARARSIQDDNPVAALLTALAA
jgi:hypothetical protein